MNELEIQMISRRRKQDKYNHQRGIRPVIIITPEEIAKSAQQAAVVARISDYTYQCQFQRIMLSSE